MLQLLTIYFRRINLFSLSSTQISFIHFPFSQKIETEIVHSAVQIKIQSRRM